jgi:peptide/nickel transport system permease protein
MPGDPATHLFVSLKGKMSQDSLDAIKRAYGFDGSLWDQYVAYLGKIFVGDFGISTTNFPAPVSETLFYAATWTLFLVGISILICFVLGMVMGIKAAWGQGRFFDTIFTPFNVMLYAFTQPVICLLLFYSVCLELQWFPLGRAHNPSIDPAFTWEFISNVLYHAAVPLASLVIIGVGSWHLGMRNTMINLLNQEFITMARAKGLSETRLVYRYAARNAILPQITSLALTFGYVLGGAFITEYVFNYPGLGKFTLAAIQSRDYSFIQSQLLLVTVCVLVANLISDLLNLWLDPRLRYAGAK